MARAGQALSEDEVSEYRAYGNASLTLPDKFANVVIENTDVRGVVYRYATAEEQKANEDNIKAVADAAKMSAELDRKVRTEASKRATEVVVPARPDAAPAPAAQRP